jgi:hypothetical protein
MMLSVEEIEQELREGDVLELEDNNDDNGDDEESLPPRPRMAGRGCARAALDHPFVASTSPTSSRWTRR